MVTIPSGRSNNNHNAPVRIAGRTEKRMNEGTTFAQDLKELMDWFDAKRTEWIEKYGTDQGFNDWFVSAALLKVR